MPEPRPTLAEVAVARHLREEAARITPEQAAQRRFRRTIAGIPIALAAIGALLAWAFLG